MIWKVQCQVKIIYFDHRVVPFLAGIRFLFNFSILSLIAGSGYSVHS